MLENTQERVIDPDKRFKDGLMKPILALNMQVLETWSRHSKLKEQCNQSYGSMKVSAVTGNTELICFLCS